uniref:Low-density lipoprotein receptor-related protein 1B n=2 Tax=Lygus hesperus TaxID=30085 RepID=A0A146L8H3_LYGHE
MKQFLSFLSILFIVQGVNSGEKDSSVIILSSSNATDVVHSGTDTYIVKNVDDALELICASNDNRSVGWVLPKYPQNRASYSQGVNGSAKFNIKHLLESDTGKYVCRLEAMSCSLPGGCTNHNYSTFATVHLYVKRKTCLGFQCTPLLCISERYMCDGIYDCFNKEDEATHICGLDPCLNKIRCSNGRCIPQEWCCLHVENCTRKWDINCCPNSGSSLQDTRIMRYLGSPQHYNDHFYKQFNNSNITFFHRDLSDFSILQTLIHTVIGCALVLVVIGPIIVIGVCRLYMRHRPYQGCRQGTTLFVTPRVIPRRSNYFTSVTYHPSPHIEAASSGEFHPFALSQGDAIERNNNTGILHDLVSIQPEGPPPYYEAIYSPQDDDQPPPYASANNSSVEDEQETTKMANILN